MGKDYKLDIGRVMENLDYGNRQFYTQLPDEEKKAFTPYTVIRWASSVKASRDIQEHYLTYINELVNVHFWSLTKHPELQWLLMSMVGFGEKQYHQWIPMAKKEKSSSLVDSLIRSKYPDANDSEMDVMRKINTDEDFIEVARALAWSDKDLKALKAELKKRHGES
jgi:hypothetical protein